MKRGLSITVLSALGTCAVLAGTSSSVEAQNEAQVCQARCTEQQKAWEAGISGALRFEDAGNFGAALRTYLELLSLAERSGRQSVQLAFTLNTLGRMYEQLGRHAGAERSYREAVRISEKNSGPGIRAWENSLTTCVLSK